MWQMKSHNSWSPATILSVTTKNESGETRTKSSRRNILMESTDDVLMESLSWGSHRLRTQRFPQLNKGLFIEHLFVCNVLVSITTMIIIPNQHQLIKSRECAIQCVQTLSRGPSGIPSLNRHPFTFTYSVYKPLAVTHLGFHHLTDIPTEWPTFTYSVYKPLAVTHQGFHHLTDIPLPLHTVCINP